MQTTCNTTEIIESIQRQLAGSSPCEDSLMEFVPVYWELTYPESCTNTYLHMLLTKRETILALMGCEARSVDAYDFHRVMNAVTKADSQSELRTQAQSTRSASTFRLGHGETRYDETNRARSRGNMDRHGIATEVGDGLSNYTDDGRGSGFNNSRSVNEIDAVETDLSNNRVDGASTEEGYRSDCNYEYSRNQTDGSAQGIPPLAAFSFSGSGSEWRKYTRTRASDIDRSTHQSNYAHTHDVNDERRGSGTHGWGSFFRANVNWFERDYDIRRGTDRTDVNRHAEAAAQGNGDGLSEEKVESRNAAQSTGKSEFQSTSTRTMNKTDNSTTVQLANSQRFRNLRIIYDQLTEQINRLKMRLRSRAVPYVAPLPCLCGSCCRCIASLGADYYASTSNVPPSVNSYGGVW